MRLLPATQRWLEIADADLDAAGVMLRTKRYLYAVFEAQQAAEKALKALIQEGGEIPPRIHDLEALASRAGLTVEGTLPGLRRLTGYDIVGRYPERWEQLRSETTRVAKELLAVAKEVLGWSRGRLTSQPS